MDARQKAIAAADVAAAAAASHHYGPTDTAPAMNGEGIKRVIPPASAGHRRNTRNASGFRWPLQGSSVRAATTQQLPSGEYGPTFHVTVQFTRSKGNYP
ncbi:unnamed protein product [Heligmosomoides polygyrus]|uniref:Secreted protein n=1 Tax=Heligmosomoides polygyrus TaxID=6339 RepID=A0A183FFG9_HELPZ|nr:unnamed protein product [Heligmosomoides polygyrus]